MATWVTHSEKTSTLVSDQLDQKLVRQELVVNWKGPRETGGLFYSRFDFLVAKIAEISAVFATRKTKKMCSAAGGFCQRTEIQLDHVGVAE